MLASSILLLIPLIVSIHGKPVDQPIGGLSNEINYATLEQRNDIISTARQVADSQVDAESAKETLVTMQTIDTTTQNPETTTSKVGPLTWFWSPFTHKIQLSPQSFLQDRIVQLKETLNNLGISGRSEESGKQLNNVNGLFHLAGGNDAGFYTDRLEPAGFFGGNGWLANKGGLLGGPGAILSTGSLLTDYPSPYRKK